MNPYALAIEHVAVRVPDPEAAAAWCQDILGLAVTGRDGGSVRLSSCPSDAVVVNAGELILLPGATTELDHVAFCVERLEDLDAAAANAERLGVRCEAATDLVTGAEGRRFVGPDDLQVYLLPQRPRIRRPRIVAPFEMTRLGHLTLYVTEPLRTAQFFIDTLGFALSDQYGDNFCWVRCNRDHHGIGALRGTFGINHVAFELRDWDAIRELCDHVHSRDWKIEYGPGRHGPGHNMFVYILSPFGVRFELFCDLERIDDPDHKPKNWGAEGRKTHVNIWGPTPPPSYTGREG